MRPSNLPPRRPLSLVPLNRTHRAVARISDASKQLDDDLNGFVDHALRALKAAETRRLLEVGRVTNELGESETSRHRERISLEATSASERLDRLKACMRLTGNWRSAVLAGRRESDALCSLFW